MIFRNLPSISKQLSRTILLGANASSSTSLFGINIGANAKGIHTIKSNLPNLQPVTRHLLTVSDLKPFEIKEILSFSKKLKTDPLKYNKLMQNKTMLMIFEKPSLRTSVSFDVGIHELGGHAIFYDMANSPIYKKELVSDASKVLTEYVDIVMARLKSKKTLDELAKYSGIPVLNGLDDFGHPCQIISDIFTILEFRGQLQGLNVVYLGDCENNVTYDLMRAVCMLGGNMRLSGPYSINPIVIKECEKLCKLSGGSLQIINDPAKACKGADVIYTDSWMSYHISAEQLKVRLQELHPYKVTPKLMSLADPKCIFMNCLPANREHEQEAAVIDGKQSVVFTQAGNRLHVQKAITLFFLDLIPKEMKQNKILVALGGNALIQPGQKGTHTEQIQNAQKATTQLSQLVKKGYQLAITHGNGPQVGQLYLQNEFSKDKIPQQPLFCNGSMTQGFIGYILQNEMQKQLFKENVSNIQCASVVTQTVVSENDPAFENPTKPVGKFYTKEEAQELKKQGYTVKEDSGRGYRIYVPSPNPKRIVEIESIKALFENNVIPIACGGGGIPVVEKNGEYEGIDAVIDKDLCGELLAGMLAVDYFIILTDVEGVYLNYKKNNQQFIKEMTMKEARQYLKDGQFGEGSMAPKIQAACTFVEKYNKPCIITSLEKCNAAMDKKAGTYIIP